MSIKEKLELKEEKTDKKRANYMVLGMVLGVLAGSILAMSEQSAWGDLSIGFGMIVGMLIGMLIPKRK